MVKQSTYVVVANSSHAKIFKMTKFPKIEAIETFDHPESRMHNVDLVSDAPGRAFGSMGDGVRHAYSNEVDPKQEEILKFARSLAIKVHDLFKMGQFNRLYLIASPSFLGLLRKHLDQHIQKTIVAEIPKDMTEHKTADIEEHIAKSLI